uniref:Nicotinate phosphoribosyltransferase-like n=1 Tax=Rhizophora mucronata TaxID=61149 RepID=A0A2P2LWD2_RHIMU
MRVDGPVAVSTTKMAFCPSYLFPCQSKINVHLLMF